MHTKRNTNSGGEVNFSEKQVFLAILIRGHPFLFLNNISSFESGQVDSGQKDLGWKNQEEIWPIHLMILEYVIYGCIQVSLNRLSPGKEVQVRWTYLFWNGIFYTMRLMTNPRASFSEMSPRVQLYSSGPRG